jgi:translocation and assembly module TamB
LMANRDSRQAVAGNHGRLKQMGAAWLRSMAAILGALLLLLFLGTVGVWLWAGSEGSLATVLNWAANRQPITADGISGSLREGGKAAALRWQQGGLDVQLHDVSFAWQPLALLDGELKIERLTAAEITVNDERPPDANKAPGPPDSLRLPIKVNVAALEIGRLALDGATRIQALALAGSYAFDGSVHRMNVTHAEYAAGRYSGTATLAAESPLTLRATVKGRLQVDVPQGQTAVPLAVELSADGPLTELRARAAVEATPSTNASAARPQGNASARIAPWASQPILEADATFSHLDVGAFWLDAPKTQLTGNASIRPIGDPARMTEQAWTIDAQVENATPGPWDKRLLPARNAQLKGQWRDGTAAIDNLTAALGDGTLTGRGRWGPVQAPSQGSQKAGVPSWQAEAVLKNINPALLHTQLAALPISGVASAQNKGTSIGFDANLNAVAKSAIGPNAATKNSKNSKSGGAPALLLALREIAVKGSWDSERVGGTLDLAALRLRTDDAQISGSVEVQPTASGGKGQLQLMAPGLKADAQGELRQTRGGGDLNLRAHDAAQALQWLKTLPGVPAELQSALASGAVDIRAAWQGGWSDPAVQAKLDVASLDWRNPPADASLPVNVVKLRGVQATLSGRLSDARLTAQGRAELGTRRIELQLAGSGGRGPLATRDTPIWRAPWQGRIEQLSIALDDPSLGAGTWRVATRSPVSIGWTPGTTAENQSRFEAGAGQALLTAPANRRSTLAGLTGKTGGTETIAPQATIAWEPVRWQAGELITSGKVTGLSMAWLELLAGPQLIDAGLTGNLLLQGQWDAVIGETVRLQASLGRVSGDIIMQAETAQRTSARVAAGIRQAQISLTSRGEALSLAVQWDSERAGTAEGRVETRLSRAAGGGSGWAWAPDAPIEGQLRAQLPRIGVWSLLAPPGWRLRGAVATDLRIAGTRTAPQLTGSLQADNLAMRSLADGIEFGNGSLRARLDGTRMRIDEFSLQGAGEKGSGGQLTAQGEAGWVNGGPEVRLNARLDRLRPSLRNDRQATVSGDVQASLIGTQAELSGKLRVDQARIVLPDEATPQLGDDVVVRTSRGAASGQKAPSQTSDAPSAVAASVQAERRTERTVKLAMVVDLGPDFQLEGKGISTRLRGTLALSGESLTNPRLNGTITTVGGQYQAYGQRLEVERGVLRFTGAIDNPSLDILAIRPNISQRVGLEILGTALLPRVRLYSQPELPDAEKLSWLIVGRASGSGGAEAALLQQAALALLGGKGGGMSGGLAASLGLDELSFRGASSNSDGGINQAAVTLGKRFSQNFYVAYERSVSGALGTLFVFYDLSQRFTFRAQAGQQAALDLIYTFAFD